MAAPINPISLMKIAAVEGANPAAQVSPVGSPIAAEPAGNIFDQMLGKAIDSINGVSEVEANANRMIDNYVAGTVELSDVVLATSKMTIAVNLAVTTITSAVSSFKEITQMPI
jgi:flagellar hook-basal body complex protein FliE